MLSCSLLRPWPARVENCQLRTSESWLQVARGGLQKNARFWAPGRLCWKRWSAHTCTSSQPIITTIVTAAHPGFISQKVVPHDGRPASRQLAHVGDDHQRERTRLEGFIHIVSNRQEQQRWQSEADSDLQVDGEALHRETGLKTEGVELLCHWEQALKHTHTFLEHVQTRLLPQTLFI